MAVNNLLKIVLHWTGIGEEGTMSWYLGGLTATPSDTQLTTLLANIDNALSTDTTPSEWTNLATILPAGQRFDQLLAYAYAVSTSPASAQAIRAVTHQGTGAGDGNPLQVAVVASLRTDRPGRSYRGRQYFPNQPYKPDGTTGLIGAGGADFFGARSVVLGSTMKEQAQSTLSNNDIYWGVYSRARGSITPITTVLVDNRTDVQRRRASSLTATHTTSLPVASNP